MATNTVLQRTGAKAALITTKGFRDVLHIQRQDRPGLYDLRARRARPLVDRALRMELTERIRFDGTVQTSLDTAELDELIDQLRHEKVEAVAVGFLHSYTNPAHEIEVGRILAAKLPEVTVCLSHELVGEHGEYERFSTCAINGHSTSGYQFLTGASAAKSDPGQDLLESLTLCDGFVQRSFSGVSISVHCFFVGNDPQTPLQCFDYFRSRDKCSKW